VLNKQATRQLAPVVDHVQQSEEVRRAQDRPASARRLRRMLYRLALPDGRLPSPHRDDSMSRTCSAVSLLAEVDQDHTYDVVVSPVFHTWPDCLKSVSCSTGTGLM
jgi:hypothetical protein